LEKLVIQALSVALLSGLAIGVQSNFSNLSSRLAGAVPTGLLIHIAGGTLSLVLFGLLLWRAPGAGTIMAQSLSAAPYWAVAGLMGIGIVTGIAFALPRAGLAAGLAGIILGQMLAAVLIDTAGWGGSRIPLSAVRVTGLLLLVIGTWLLLPRTAT
jgi:uncharacterized membrane protein YdcZ (DUF606 family)